MRKIAVGTVKSFLKENRQDDTITMTIPVGESSFEVRVKTTLDIGERSVFINRVLSGCFDSENNFRPEYVEPMKRATILQMCTNVPVITLKNVQGADGAALMDLDAMNELYRALKLDEVENVRYLKMAFDLSDECDRAIEWKKGRILAGRNEANIQAMAALGDMAVTIRDVVQALGDKAEKEDLASLMKYAGQLSTATENLDEGGILKGLLEYSKENN